MFAAVSLPRRLVAIAALPALAAVVTACAAPAAGSSGAAAGSGPPARPVAIDSRVISGVGDVLVTTKGYALYMFQPDSQRQVTCTGLCAATWPPVKIAPGATLSAGPGVRSSLLSTDKDPAGGTVVTYNGWPLYTYSGDVQPGQITGQAIDLNGGDWYLMRPSGQPLTTGPG